SKIESARMAKRDLSRVKRRIKSVRRLRDYTTEYARRIARALSSGLSKSQGRGHPKPAESLVSSRKRLVTLDDERLQRGLRVLRQEKNLSAAARAIHVSPERLKHAAAEKAAITKQGRRWVVNPELPRRMPIYSRNKLVVVTVGDHAAA